MRQSHHRTCSGQRTHRRDCTKFVRRPDSRSTTENKPRSVPCTCPEQALWETAAGSNMEVVIVRAPLVYGPRVGANFLRLLRAVDRGTPLPLGSVKNRRSLCYVENLTSAIMSCLDHPAAGGQVFLVADEQAPSTRELVCRLGELLGRSPRLLPIPILLLRIAGRISGKSDEIRRLTGSLLLSTAKIRQRLDWRPPFTLDDGLRTTVAWYRSLE